MADEVAHPTFIELKSLNSEEQQEGKEVVVELDMVLEHGKTDHEEELDDCRVDLCLVIHEEKPLPDAGNRAEGEHQTQDDRDAYFWKFLTKTIKIWQYRS